MLVSTVGGGDDDGVSGGSGDVCPPLSKHYSPIYCDSYNIGAVSIGRASTRSADGQEMVVLVIIGLKGNTFIGKGGVGRGSDKRVIRWRQY